MGAGLWEQQQQRNRHAAEPLAVRMRPQRLEQFIGQRQFLAPGTLLWRMLEADRLTSVIFYGPPGCGKTTLAEVIASHTKRRFERANAGAVGVREVREVLNRARQALENDARRTIFFLDEIHRFNRAQQDVLLGDVERGIVTLIGATTENPFFAINAPLVSRSAIFQFEPLSEAEVVEVLQSALDDPERGYGGLDLRVDDEALGHWATVSDGDARRALSALEIAVSSSTTVFTDAEGRLAADGDRPAAAVHIDLAAAEQSIQRKALVYDGTGDEHYDVISAFIKSMRGSDPDAAVYWLARMLDAGEDPRFIARRIAILASEDIGNADPHALTVAASACAITERIGMPECQLTLAQAAIYMATTPKSNASATAIWTAMTDVREGRTIPVPKHLRDGHYGGAKRLGHGRGYQYAHKGEGGYVDQEYLGVDKCYYEPTDRGDELRIRKYLEWLEERRSGETPGRPEDDAE
ncbi:MAG: AAA family ATPase [Phycisphaeraceae bacterium]|nr:AAA family ATPase [Phycisphaeraceae bacterium]